MRKLAGTDHALPVEGRGDALDAFAAGGEERRDHQHQHERAHANGSRARQPRRRRAGLERLGRAQRALDMGAPQRHANTSPRSARRSRRRSRWPADAAGRSCGRAAAGRPSGSGTRTHQERREGRGREQEEDAETDRPPDRRQPQPQPEPGHGQEQADHGGDRRQRRPQPLPEDRPARAAERPRQHAVAGRLRAAAGAASWAGSARPGTDRSTMSPARESGRLPILTRN